MEQGAELKYKVPDGHEVFIYTLRGTGKCAGDNIGAHHAIAKVDVGDRQSPLNLGQALFQLEQGGYAYGLLN